MSNGSITYETDGSRYAVKSYVRGILEEGNIPQICPKATSYPNLQHVVLGFSPDKDATAVPVTLSGLKPGLT